MSLRFCFGSSGAGKSYQLHKEMIERSLTEPGRNFLILVPDQFTMQTQKELVTRHPNGIIMNIDVLSFTRLSHRIFEEVGYDNRPILDDTGKSLVLRRIAARCKEDLLVLGGNLNKQGYIHEVKSAISEFMQYGIGLKEMDTLLEFAEKRGALSYKLKDLKQIYQEFLAYIDGKFLTTEETLDLLRGALHKSNIIKDSVVVFDGFTGFTPIQNRLIQELMLLCREVVVSITIPANVNPYVLESEQQLFHLSQKTVHDLSKLAAQIGTTRAQDLVLKDNPRFNHSESLAHLEKYLFRYPLNAYDKEQESIYLYEASDPKEEVRQTAMKIRQLVREEGIQFRDIAVVTGDLAAYGEDLEEQFSLFQIPCFIDRTRGILLNPFIEFIRSGLSMIYQDFSYESVFHFLRSGLADFTMQEIDILENYIIRFGIRGKRKYGTVFTKKTKEMSENPDSFTFINSLRERLMNALEPLFIKEKTVKAYVEGLYTFLVHNQMQEKLLAFENKFTKEMDLSKAREYAQIYPMVINLLDQIIGLLEDETMTLKEFADILDAGFGEIEVGMIPQNVDRVVAGDIERTRLKQIKALFFLGVNDGNIPKNGGKGGIISDMDREFLRESNLELAPSPRQQMYIQRLYLYLNMTKPSQKLYLSYSSINGQGKSLRPAYLIDTMKKLFPKSEVELPQMRPPLWQLETQREGLNLFAQKMRNYAQNYEQNNEEEKLFFTLYNTYHRTQEYRNRNNLLMNAAFYEYQHHPIAKAVARALYGNVLVNSVTRLETYAACAYKHFLEYGLSLKEREEFNFETVDMGNIYHGVLEIFGEKLKQKGLTWFDFSTQVGEELIEEALNAYGAEYGDTILFASKRNEYAIGRMRRILCRTVNTLQNQLRKGSFEPSGFEMSFSMMEDLETVNIALSEEEKMRIKGRIDRVDTLEEGNKLYVKVIDYKSGNKQFDLVALYHGLQLQLVVYLNAAMDAERKKHPDKEVVPAALLYYHIADPMLSIEGKISEEELNEKILGELRMNGVVNSNAEIIHHMDHSGESKSSVIPIEWKKDGTLSARSSVLEQEELRIVSDYVNHKVKNIGREIIAGNFQLSPYEFGTASGCTYCAFQAVCGFDPRIPGCKSRKLEEISKEEIVAIMEEAIQEKEET